LCALHCSVWRRFRSLILDLAIGTSTHRHQADCCINLELKGEATAEEKKS